jgi:sigma-B regulation protein RsbU (phosphoserine phosphatase)
MAMLRGQVGDIMAGSVFLFVGLTACAIAVVRGHRQARIFVWLGIWSALYGGQLLSQSPAALAAMPRWMQAAAPAAHTAMIYLLVVFGLLSFLELSLDPLRRLIQAAVVAGLAIAVAGMTLFAVKGAHDSAIRYNNALAAGMLLVLTTVVAVPARSNRWLLLPDRRVLTIGTLVFTTEALYNSLSRPLGFEEIRVLDHIGFAVLLFSFGYVALQLVLGNERRLLSVENELAIARGIQISILPASVPRLHGAIIRATYRPMTAVAGDVYEFLAVDEHRVGCFVADVCGHGVPAALIASMVKVGVDTVAAHADDPCAVLRGLNRVMSTQARGQLVSAAYLWVDTEQRCARYSAAGHPPLLWWRDGTLEAIESNGLLFGVMPERDTYPVRTLPVVSGDRFVLYTDGLTESQNAKGEFFGDSRLEGVIRTRRTSSAAELSDRLLAELSAWQGDGTPQQDDITLIVVDIID